MQFIDGQLTEAERIREVLRVHGIPVEIYMEQNKQRVAEPTDEELAYKPDLDNAQVGP